MHLSDSDYLEERGEPVASWCEDRQHSITVTPIHRTFNTPDHLAALTPHSLGRLVHCWASTYDPHGALSDFSDHSVESLTRQAAQHRDRILAALAHTTGEEGRLTVHIVNTARPTAWTRLHTPSTAWFHEATSTAIEIPLTVSPDGTLTPTEPFPALSDLIYVACLFSGCVTFEPANGTRLTRRWLIPHAGALTLCPSIRRSDFPTPEQYTRALRDASWFPGKSEDATILSI